MGSFVGVFCIICLVILNIGLIEASMVFKVGDDMGWQEPAHNNSALYGQWAQRNRFRVGDSLSFVYKNDSVIEVDKWGYYHCNDSHHFAAFNNGRSVFKLDRPGPFYFISGTTNHCNNGQRLIVEVMGNHHHRLQPPPSIASPPESQLAPSPQPSSAESVSLIYSSASMVVSAAAFIAFSCSTP